MLRRLLCALLFLLAAPASAQAPASTTVAEPAASDEAVPPVEYRETIDAAVAEFAVGHHAEARALFRRAHASFPSARTLRGIGMCSFELREYADAVRALSAALSDGRRPLTDEQRAQVEATLARADAFVGRFTVSAPGGSELLVDGAASPTALEPDGSLLLTLGAHVVSARREGVVTAEVRVDVQGGERAALTLTPQVHETEPQGTEPPSETEPPGEATPVVVARAVVDPTPAITLLSVGGVVAIAGAVLLGLGLSDASSVTNAAPGTPWSSLRSAYERAPIFEGLGAALLGVGAASAIVGGVWLALPHGSSEPQGSVQVDLSLGAFRVRGSF